MCFIGLVVVAHGRGPSTESLHKVEELPGRNQRLLLLKRVSSPMTTHVVVVDVVRVPRTTKVLLVNMNASASGDVRSQIQLVILARQAMEWRKKDGREYQFVVSRYWQRQAME